ncbi:MAG: aminopeptidase [Patescibacteria group bacterium]|jgi:aspartyl aminopeptidase
MNKDLTFDRKFGYEVWDKARIDKAFEFAQGYKDFLSAYKTEREVVSWSKNQAEKQGFIGIDQCVDPKNKNRKIYSVNRGKSIVLGVFGQKPVVDGIQMILAHVDAPRIDLKPMPLYESEKIAWLKTQYYGGIKKYQWPAVPLALHGTIVLTSGEKVEVLIGEDEADPVFTITDLLPHLSRTQMEKKLDEAVAGEDLNIIIGSRPRISKAKDEGEEKKEKDAVKLGVLELLNKKYGITEEDFVSADLEIVPTGKARDLGFDASLVGGYGQDDRICVYTALKALLEVNDPVRPIMIILVDREEIGSESNTGALSSFIPDFVSEMLYLQTGTHDENLLRDCLTKSQALSADVTTGFDPDYSEVFDGKNTARIGAGVVLEKYTGRRGKSDTNEATAEYLAKIRNIFNKNNILWQTGGLGKVDLGGGGTIAMFLARHNMDVVDAGPPLLSMHSPFEISSKIDLYAAFEAYKAFLSA